MPEAAPAEGTGIEPEEGLVRVESDSVSLRELRRDKRIALFAVALSTALIFAWPFATIGLGLDRFLAGGACLAPVAGLIAAVMSLATLHGDPVAGTREKGTKGKLEVRPEGVTVEVLGERRRFAKEDLDGGWVETAGARHTVVLRMRSGAVVAVDLPSAEAAQELLRAAGVAPEQHTVAIPLGGTEPRAMRRVLAIASMILGAFTLPFAILPIVTGFVALYHGSLEGVGTAALTAIPAALGLFGIYLAARPLITSTLVIGTDGVTVATLGRRRFVPFAPLRAIVQDGGTVRLEHHDGRVVKLATSGAEEAAAVAVRIREAMAAGERGRVQSDLERLDRRGRSLAEWRDELLAMARENKGYRENAFGRRELLQVVEDARAAAERRIAAAAALSEAPDPEVRQRIRVAIDTCADERLRVAIDRAAAGEVEDEAVEEALRARVAR